MGFFITFEGVEGCGKTTQIKKLRDRLTTAGYRVIMTREPGGCPIADKIRTILLDAENCNMKALTELLLYAAARAQHVAEVIVPALESGAIVLCDRFTDATIAYQHNGRGIERGIIDELNILACQAQRPDLTVLLDCDAASGLARARDRIEATSGPREERFELEQLSFHQRVRDGYLKLAVDEPERFLTVNAMGTIDQISETIASQVLKFLVGITRVPFADITGHERIVEVFRRSVRSGKISHSYIFEGIPGCGRRKTALTLIQAIFCSSVVDDACGVCPSCRKIDRGNHGDIHFVEPLPDKRDISIDQLREIQRELSLRPYEAPRKACILEPAERMSVNAANSLLKTLEEPPGNAIIILLTENADMLLPTIRSRCQLIRFSPLSTENVRLLLEKNGIAPDAADLLAPLSEGSMQRASDLDNDALSARRDLLVSHLSALDIDKIASIFNTAEELAGNRDETLASLDLLLSFARDTVYLHAGSSDIVNTSIRPALESFAERCTLQGSLQMLGAITETRRAVQRNANNKLALDCLFMKLAEVIA